ncbi:hypothetical protein LG274_02780 [Micrococcus antarcticus]|uniref:hypothetical protein n=1 Tax=Micrococcus antarcticus TaxID=86171 RepID=UPI00384F7A83
MPTPTLTARSVALHLPGVTLTGTVHYDRRRSALWLEDEHGERERLSVDLGEYGLVAVLPGEVWIKDWAEHAGLAGALVDAGLVMTIDRAYVGPFASRAYLCLVLDPELAR